MSKIHLICQNFRQLLADLDDAAKKQAVAMPGDLAAVDVLYQCRVKIIGYVADVLTLHSEVIAVDAAVEAFETVLSPRYNRCGSVVVDVAEDNFKIQVAGVVLGLLCSTDQRSACMPTVLRLIIAVKDALRFIELQIQHQSVFVLANLLDHSLPLVRLTSAKILADSLFISNDLLRVIAQKAIGVLSSSTDDGDCVLAFVFLLVKVAQQQPDVFCTLPDNSSLNPLPFVLSRVMRISASMSSSVTTGQITPTWRVALINSIQLVEFTLKSAIRAGLTRLIDALVTFEVVDELIERLRSPDDLVAEATLRCLCCLSSSGKKCGDKFFALNCHVTTFKYLSEAFQTYLKINFRHLLLPVFELFKNLTSGPSIPDSSSTSEVVMSSIYEAVRTLPDAEVYVAVDCAASLLSTRFVALPVVYESVEALMRRIVDVPSCKNPTLLASASNFCASLTRILDWAGLKNSIDETATTTTSFVSPLVRFASSLIEFITNVVQLVCKFLAAMPPDSTWLSFKPIIDAVSVCIEKCHDTPVSHLFSVIHNSPFLFHCLWFKSILTAGECSSTIDKAISGVVVDFMLKQRDFWEKMLSKFSTTVTGCALLEKRVVASFVQSLLHRLNKPIAKLVTEFSHPEELCATLLILTCSGAVCLSQVGFSRESAQQFLVEAFREMVHLFYAQQQKVDHCSFEALLLLFTLSFIIECAIYQPALLSPILDKEVDAVLTSLLFDDEKNLFLWYAVQPELATWCLLQAEKGQINLAVSLFDFMLRIRKTTDNFALSEWSKFVFTMISKLSELEATTRSTFSKPLADVLVAVSLGVTEKENHSFWLELVKGFFSIDERQAVEELKFAILKPCFEKVSCASVSAVTSSPTAAFLHLMATSICNSPAIASDFVEQDRLALTSFLNRLVNTVRLKNAKERYFWLEVLNFLNSILIIYWSSAAAPHHSPYLAQSLQNFALTIARCDSLIKSLLFAVTKTMKTLEKSKIESSSFSTVMKTFCASLVTVSWLYRLVPRDQDLSIREKLFTPIADIFLQPCSCCSTSSPSSKNVCRNALLASFILGRSGSVLSWVTVDFAETLLWPRFFTSSTALQQSAIFAALLQVATEDFRAKPWFAGNAVPEVMQPRSTADDLATELRKEFANPWLMLSKKVLSKSFKKDGQERVVENVKKPTTATPQVIPILVDGIVIAHY